MWRDLIPKARPWPESLKGSASNPNQLVDAQDSSKLALEVAAPANSTTESRVNRFLCIELFLLAVLIFAALNFILPATDYLAVSYATIFVALGVFVFILANFGSLPLRVRLPVGFACSYLLYYYLYFPPRPASLLVVSILLLFAAADTVATHLFRIRTIEIAEADRIERLRGLWNNRFNPFASQVVGLEYYWLLIPMCGLSAYLAYRNIPDPQRGYPFSNAKGFYVAAAVPLAFFLLSGPVSALIHRRGFLRHRTGLKVVPKTFFRWLNYNRNELRFPGIVQSSIQSSVRRRFLVYAIWVVVIAASNAHFHRGLEFGRSAKFGDAMAVRLPPSMKWLLPNGHQEWLEKERLRNDFASDGINIDQIIDDGILYAPTPSLEQGEFVEVDGVLVEPRQAKILERLEGDARETYLNRARQEQQEREAKALIDAEDEIWRVADERLKAQTQNWAYLPLVAAWTVWQMVCYAFYALFFGLVITFPMFLAVVYQPLNSLQLLGLKANTSTRKENLSTEDWNNAVTRMRGSHNKVERESIFLGVNAVDRSPIIVPRSVFEEHMHLLGDSGSGKTSLGIAPLMTQLIASGDCSVILLDMKGDDHSLIETARLGAEEANIGFRWFTNQLGNPTYLFNPLTQEFLSNLTLSQRADILSAGLGLQYGSDYGRSFFGDSNTALLHAAFEFNPNIDSFVELLEVLDTPEALRGLPQDTKRAASHIRIIVKRLADWEPLNATEDGPYSKEALDNAIDLSDVFRTPQVIAFHIASALGTSSSAEMGRLALYSLMSGAKAAGTKREKVFLIIDEFQRIVSSNVELLLQTARSMDIGVILANQTLMDLKTGGVDLIPAVRANTRIKQVFAASDLSEQQETSATSGETIYTSKSWNTYVGLFGVSIAGRMFGSKEEISPRLRPNEILAMTDHPQRSVLHVRRGKGFARFAGLPFVMESAFHIGDEEYKARRDAAWPDRGQETITPKLRTSEMKPAPTTQPIPPAEPISNVSEAGSKQPAEPKPFVDLLADLDTSDKIFPSKNRKRKKRPPDESQ